MAEVSTIGNGADAQPRLRHPRLILSVERRASSPVHAGAGARRSIVGNCDHGPKEFNGLETSHEKNAFYKESTCTNIRVGQIRCGLGDNPRFGYDERVKVHNFFGPLAGRRKLTEKTLYQI